MLNTRRIALDGVLAAVYFALSYLAFYVIPNELKLTFTSLTLVLAALLFSWYDACLVALVGEFLAQLLNTKYGLSVTTPIWVAIPVLHALALGLCALFLGRKKPLAERTVPCVLAVLGCGAFNALLNTAGMYFDSKIFGYYEYHLVFGLALARIGIAIATAAVIAALIIPIVRAVRRQVPAI